MAKALNVISACFTNSYHVCRLTANPVLIIGGGRVGQTIAGRFEERGMPYLIIEKNPRRVQEAENYVLGDAADIRTLQNAWIEKAPAALAFLRAC